MHHSDELVRGSTKANSIVQDVLQCNLLLYSAQPSFAIAN